MLAHAIEVEVTICRARWRLGHREGSWEGYLACSAAPRAPSSGVAASAGLGWLDSSMSSEYQRSDPN